MRRAALAMSQSEVSTTVANRRRTAVVVTASGEVNIGNSRSISAAVARAADPTATSHVLLDMSRVVHIDSAGLSATVASLRRAAEAGLQVGMIVGTPWLMRRCAITGVDQEVAVFTSIDAALTSGGLSWGAPST